MEDQSRLPKYILRRTTSNDFTALNDVFNKFTGRSRTIEQYLWQWVDNPSCKSESWVIEYLITEQIVGHHGVMCLNFLEEGKPISVGKTENTFVDPDHSTNLYYPGFEKQALNAMKGRFAYIYTTAPDAGRGAVGLIRKRLGYAPVGRISDFYLNIPYEAAKVVFKNKFPFFKAGTTLLAIFITAFQRFKQIVNFPKLKNTNIIPLPWDRLEEISQFWRGQNKYYGITVDRNVSYLRWRLADNPYINYSLVKIMKNEKIIAYSILKENEASNKNGNVKIIYIEDLIVDKASLENYCLALSALIGKYNNHRVIITTLLQDDTLNHAIKRVQGLLRRWLVKPGPEMLVWGKNVKANSWYFTNILREGIS